MDDSKSGQTLFFDRKWKAHVIEHDDGSLTAKSHGTTVRLDRDGDSTINLDNFRFIGIKNIPDLLDYTITREGDLIRHTIRLVNDGEAVLEYGTDLKFHSFGMTHAKLHVTAEGDVIIEASDEPKG